MILKIKFIGLFLLALNLGFSQGETVELRKLKLNNKLDHFGAHVVGDKVYFSANLTSKRGNPLKDKYDGFIYVMYEAPLSENGEITDAILSKSTSNHKFSMSSATFSKDGKFMYYTTNNQKRGSNKDRAIESYNLQIQRAELVEGKGWTNFETLAFCDPDSNFAHPALSPDDTTLYFISDQPGTKGKSDLYKVSVSGHSTYGEVERLDDAINSPRTEVMPFISADNKLYFSSDRRGGKGGKDIYVYDLNTTDPEVTPVSLKSPINGKGDDYSFFLNDDLSTGYLSSRRSRGSGGDDLYYFQKF